MRANRGVRGELPRRKTGSRRLLSKPIVFCGRDVVLSCDGMCCRAWGVDGRPKTSLSDNPDDFVYLGDGDAGDAPGPGKTSTISEGGEPKPCGEMLRDASRMNRWCARQCERSVMTAPGEEIVLPDMAAPRPNIPDASSAPAEARSADAPVR